MDAGYGLFEVQGSLMIVHGRAAFERVQFEQIEGKLHAGDPPRQPLLIPSLLELPPIEASVLGDQLAFFDAMGFEIEPFGRHLYRMRAAPAWLDKEHPEPFIETLVRQIRDRGLRPDDRAAAHKMVARLAAIRIARGYLAKSGSEWQELIGALLSCENPLLDSRGRPTFFALRPAELRRKFMLEGEAQSTRDSYHGN